VNLPDLLASAGEARWSGMPAGTVMGHLHLHVGDLDGARAFYSDGLGFDRMVWQYPGALFLDCALEPDAPFADEHCGTCTRCLDACPTKAFVAPQVLDARRCISYLTIELRGPIPESLHASLGDHLYGCDVCQDVCPWNVKFARPDGNAALAATPPVADKDATTLAREILAMDETAYRNAFRHSAMKRAKLDGLQRNAALVLQNRGEALT